MSIYLRKKSWYYDFAPRGQRYTGSVALASRRVAKGELARQKAKGSPRENRANRFLRFARCLFPQI